MNQLLTFTPLILALLLAALLWCLTLILLSYISGWKALARLYTLSVPFEGPRWHWQHAQFRWSMNYSACVTVGASAAGLYLAIMPPFNVGHPRLFIPWSETRIEMKRTWLAGEYMEVRFRQLPSVLVSFGARLAKRLAATVNILSESQPPSV